MSDEITPRPAASNSLPVMAPPSQLIPDNLIAILSSREEARAAPALGAAHNRGERRHKPAIGIFAGMRGPAALSCRAVARAIIGEINGRRPFDSLGDDIM